MILSEKRSKKIVLIMDILFYLMLLVLTAIVSKRQIYINVLHVYFKAVTICGLITAVNCIQLLWIIITYKRSGFFLSSLLCGINIISMLIPIVRGMDTKTVPGIAIVLVNWVTLATVYKYISETDKGKQMLLVQANTDSLTGLPNMRAFQKHIKELVENNQKFAIVFIDIDNFKIINDVAGHNMGDSVLKFVSHEWTKRLDDGDYIVRIGGDEFAIAITVKNTKMSVIEHVNNISDIMNTGLGLSYGMFRVTASFGIAFYPEDGTDCTTLLSCADTAMYHSKDDGKAKVTIYNSNMLDKLRVSVEIEHLIKDAVRNERFFMVFQPQYSAKNHILKGFEALIRINDSGKTIYPGSFISVAESNGLIYNIDRWVMRNIMTRFSELLNEYETDITISINISAAHLLDKEFVSETKKLIQETGFPSKCLEIEVTESVCLTSIEHAADVLRQLHDMGITLVIDDFGTGYASLSYLSKLPVQIVKIDKTFIDNIAVSKGADDFVEAIISMGHTLKMDIIAEGVEDENQLSILKNIGCDYIQGYVWDRLVSEERARNMIYESFGNIYNNKKTEVSM